MAKCEVCGNAVVVGKYGDGKSAPVQTVVLDASARCFAAVSDEHPDAQDGDRLFQSNAFVEHKSVCRGKGKKREQG